jgi:putative membrane protein
MNMNRKGIKLAVAATVISITAASCLLDVGASKSNNFDKKKEVEAEAVAATKDSVKDAVDNEVVNTVETVAGTTQGDADKEETVYITADAHGKTQSVIVSDWLKNTNKEGAITDVSNLTNIENVKGYETYTTNSDGTITWASAGEDIYYQGETTQELPVSMKVTYYLNDKEVLPEALAGKSGRVKIRFDYTNHSVNKVKIGEEESDIYTPFTMITGMILPSENFSNVAISKGNIISDGNNKVVVGFAMPGLEESLDLKDKKDIDFDMPSYFEVTADVTDFSLDMTATIATADVLSDFDIDGMEDFDDFDESMNDLTDSSKKLVDGTTKLSDSVITLKDGTTTLREGVETLNGKSAELLDGMSTLANGATELNEGVGKLAKGSDSLEVGAKELNEGTQTLVDGLNQTKAGADTLVSSYPTAIDGSNQIVAGLAALNDGANTLQNGVSSMDDSLAASIAEYTAKIQEAEAGISEAEAAKSDLQSQELQLIDGIKATAAANGDTTVLEEQLSQVQAGIAQYDAGITNAYNLKGQAEGAVAALSQIQSQMASSGLTDGVAAITSGSGDLLTGATSLSTGINQLYAGTQSIQSALGSLAEGGEKLKDGTNSIYGGASELNSGVSKIDTATDQLASGTATLYDGGVEYTDGVFKLKDGGVELDDGVKKLKNGAIELKDGMVKFDDEGITELSDSFDGDIKPLKDRVNAVKDAGDNYKIFSSVKDGTTSSVKFIFTTDGI